jgi:chemotaxis protein MotB
MFIIQMNKIINVFLVLTFFCCLAGCAHRPSAKEYADTVSELKSCREQLDKAKTDNVALEARLGVMKKDIDASAAARAFYSTEKQELLDRNIQCLEDNKLLLKQISRLKAVSQEKKDAQWRLDKAHEFLMSSLNQERVNDQLYIIKNEDKIKIVLPQRVLFPAPASAWLMPGGVSLVKKIAWSLDKLKAQEIEVAGHCDSTPIAKAFLKTYPTHWDLGNARAVSVLLVLENSGIKKDRLTSLSHGNTRPIADSATEEGKAMNRRVEISITP